jgi:hypothetical protein
MTRWHDPYQRDPDDRGRAVTFEQTGRTCPSCTLQIAAAQGGTFSPPPQRARLCKLAVSSDNVKAPPCRWIHPGMAEAPLRRSSRRAVHALRRVHAQPHI